MHENENPCEGHFDIGCWTDLIELTIDIFAADTPRPMEEGKRVVAVHRKAYPDIPCHAACTFLEAAVCSCQWSE